MLSIVIPTLNAAATLAATLDAVSEGDGVEIVIADGGSIDATLAVARARKVRLIAAPRGRGSQLAAGIAASRGEWLLLLHADTRLAPGWFARCVAFMAAQPDCAGYGRFTLDAPAAAARRLERQVAWRSRVLGLPYGDQALLLSRALLSACGGMPPLPLMEDVALVRRIGRHRLRPLDIAAHTSAARWQREGWRRRSARNILCLMLYFLGVPPTLLIRLYS
jgi:rSAM/selenodomain-associated transferase 2